MVDSEPNYGRKSINYTQPWTRDRLWGQPTALVSALESSLESIHQTVKLESILLGASKTRQQHFNSNRACLPEVESEKKGWELGSMDSTHHGLSPFTNRGQLVLLH